MSSSLSPAQVAERWNVPVGIVRGLIRSGQLHSIQYTRKTHRVPLWSVEDHEAKQRLFRIPTKTANPHHSGSL